MEKLNKMTCNLQKDSSYLEYLKSLKKDELDYIRKILKVKGVSKLKKDELAEILSENIIENLQNILDTHAKSEDQNFYNVLVQNNGFMMLTDELEESAVNLRSLGIIFFIKDGNDTFAVLPKEVMNLREQGKIELEENSANSKWGEAACGLLYFYGVMDKEELYKKVCTLINEKIELNEFADILDDICKSKNIIKVSNNLVYSKDVIDAEKVNKAQSERGDIEFYNPSLEEVLEASSESYMVSNKYTEELQDVLAANPKLTEEDEVVLTKKCFNLIRNNFNFMEILDEFSKYVGFSSMEEGNKFIKAVQQLENNSRLWVLKGNTTEEIFQYKKKQIDETCKVNNTNNDVTNDVTNNEINVNNKVNRKIGRNEPCPCGSGKKYKKCCGKN